MRPLLLAAFLMLPIAQSYSAKKVIPDAPGLSIPSSKAKVFTFDNGLTLIVEEDRSAPVASVQAWCATGSIDEGDWMGAGLSHILEHMLFKGTETRKGGDIAKQIQGRGGYINAYTSFDRTVFWIDVPAEGASEAVAILADSMMNSTLPPQEYDKEQEVIRREFAMGFDDPDRMSSQLMFRTLFRESPFQHPVIGYLDIYNKLGRDDVMRYYKARYVPNNLFFVVVGDVDAGKIRDQLAAAFEKYPRRALPPVYVPSEPRQIGRRDAHEEFATELTHMSLAWRIPPVSHPDTPALDLLGQVLGGGRSSPLYRKVREEKALAHGISSGSYSLNDEGIFVIDAVCDPDKRADVERESLALLDHIRKEGVSDADLAKAKRTFLAAQLGSLATARGKASDLGSNWLLSHNLNLSRDYLAAVEKVTSDDIRRVAAQYLHDDSVTSTSLNPPGSLAQKGEAVAAPGEIAVRKFELPNGLRLLVRKNPKLPLVSLAAVFKGGLLAETKADNGITALVARTVIKGTKTRSAEKLADEIESAGGDIAATSSNNSFTIAMQVLAPDLPLGIDILSDVIRNAAFPDAEVEREKVAQLAGIKAEEDQVTTVARNGLREKFFGSHPYSLRANGSAESVASLKPAQLREFFRRYATARNCVLSVAGDVRADEVFKLVQKAFSELPSGESIFDRAEIPVPPKESSVVAAERQKQQAIVMVGYPGVALDDPDRVTMELIETASSDLASRFFERIREKMGLAYFVGASQFVGPVPGLFAFYLGTDPAKLERVRKEFADEIASLGKEGLTPEELDRAKNKILGAEAIRNQSNAAFAQSVAMDELYGLGYDQYLKRRKEIEKVTVEDTRRVAQKHFAESAHVESLVAPPPKPTPTPTTP